MRNWSDWFRGKLNYEVDVMIGRAGSERVFHLYGVRRESRAGIRGAFPAVADDPLLPCFITPGPDEYL